MCGGWCEEQTRRSEGSGVDRSCAWSSQLFRNTSDSWGWQHQLPVIQLPAHIMPAGCSIHTLPGRCHSPSVSVLPTRSFSRFCFAAATTPTGTRRRLRSWPPWPPPTPSWPWPPSRHRQPPLNWSYGQSAWQGKQQQRGRPAARGRRQQPSWRRWGLRWRRSRAR